MSDNWSRVCGLFERTATSVFRQTASDFRHVVVCHEPPKLKRATPLVRDKELEARDKWIYEECCKGTAYALIAIQLKAKLEWNSIDTVPGIRKAGMDYAERHGLPAIPRRQKSKPE